MSRNINATDTNILWGLSAGRCELCNKLLGLHPSYMQKINIGERAHIHAYSENGPRYIKEIEDKKNSIENLMLLCLDCHTLIDRNPSGYSAEFLKKKKYEHELRVWSLMENKNVQVSSPVYYFANINGFHPEYELGLYRQAIVANGFLPSAEHPVNLGYDEMPFRDGTQEFYALQANAIESKAKISLESLRRNTQNIAVFALAPMPLLVKLGTVLRDVSSVSVYQCHRTGHKWSWKDRDDVVEYLSASVLGKIDAKEVALVISLSAEIHDERVKRVADFANRYTISIPSPNREFVTTEAVADDFVRTFRKTMETIKMNHINIEKIHVFMAMPNSLAIRMGMDYMPKTDPILVLYDQIKAGEDFVKTLEIGGI